MSIMDDLYKKWGNPLTGFNCGVDFDWSSPFDGIKAEWKVFSDCNNNPTYILKGNTSIQLIPKVQYHGEYIYCLMSSKPATTEYWNGTLRECLEYYDKHFYKEKKMEEHKCSKDDDCCKEEKEVKPEIRWYFKNDNKFMLATHTGYAEYKGYIVFYNYITDTYRFLDGLDPYATVYEHVEAHKVFEFAKGYIASSADKDQIREKANALDKEADELRKQAAELRMKLA